MTTRIIIVNTGTEAEPALAILTIDAVRVVSNCAADPTSTAQADALATYLALATAGTRVPAGQTITLPDGRTVTAYA